MRIVNTDRNDGNILIDRDSGRLAPVDHGYSLPSILEIAWCDWVWLDWPQVKLPISQELREFIRSIDVDEDIERLESANLSFRPECLENMRITVALLKKGVDQGLSLYDIAKIIARDNLDAPSLLEITVAQSHALARHSLESSSSSPSISTTTSSSSSSGSSTLSPSSDSSPPAAGIPRSQSFHPLEKETVSLSSRRSSLGAFLSDLEEREYQREFWKFLTELMDCLVARKAAKIGNNTMMMMRRIRSKKGIHSLAVSPVNMDEAIISVAAASSVEDGSFLLQEESAVLFEDQEVSRRPLSQDLGDDEDDEIHKYDHLMMFRRSSI